MRISFGNGWVLLIVLIGKDVIQIVASLTLYETGRGTANPIRIIHVYRIVDCCVFAMNHPVRDQEEDAT
jgi:hypothetical protein